MFTILAVIHILVCVVLILAVLLQSGKGQGLSSAFGNTSAGGMATSMFGGRGATTVLTKVTVVLASLYMMLVLGLNYFPSSAQRSRSVIREEALKNQQSSPAQGLPAAQPPSQPPAGVPQPVQVPVPTGTEGSSEATPGATTIPGAATPPGAKTP